MKHPQSQSDRVGAGACVIHHPFDAPGEAGSPFEDALVDVIEGAEVILAYPYIDTAILVALVERATTWRLISDVEAWLKTQRLHEREATLGFLREHAGRVRHCPALHAKVVASSTRALIGSANLTRMGLTKRQEVGVLLRDPFELARLHDWFNALWKRTGAPDGEQARRLAQESPEPMPPGVSRPRLSTPYNGVSAQLQVDLAKSRPVDGAEKSMPTWTGGDRADLIRALRRMPSRAFAETYLDLVHRVQVITGFSESDPRWSCNLRRDGSRIPVLVGQRYVLCAKLVGGPELAHVGLMVPSTLVTPTAVKDRLVSFNPDEFALQGDETRAEHTGYLSLRIERGDDTLEGIWRSWEEAVRRQAERVKGPCPHRRLHQPLILAAALRPPVRESILSEAFDEG